MYVIKRIDHLTGRSSWFSNDTGRNFWYNAPDKRWMKAWLNKEHAETALETVKANYISRYTYTVEYIVYSLADVKKFLNVPLDANRKDLEQSYE